MTKQFTFKQLFSLTDGRLSTEIGDVYDMLGHICQFDGIMTHHLPTAMKYLEEKNPQWFADLVAKTNAIKAEVGDDFETLMQHIDEKHNYSVDVPQIPDDELAEFGKFMLDNSLLKGNTVIPVQGTLVDGKITPVIVDQNPTE